MILHKAVPRGFSVECVVNRVWFGSRAARKEGSRNLLLTAPAAVMPETSMTLQRHALTCQPDPQRSSQRYLRNARSHANAEMMTRGTSPTFPVHHMFPTCDLVSKCAYGSGRAMGQSEERKSSRRGERLRAFHHMMPTDDVTNSLFHVSSNSPDVWWSLPDGISEKLPLPPGRWQRIEELSRRIGVQLSPDLLLRCLTQDMYYYLLMPGAQCTLNQLQQDGSREDGSREDGSRKDESKRSTASGPPRSDEPITYFTAHSRLRSHLEAVGDSVLALTCVLHLVRQQPPLSMGDLTSRKDKLVSNRSLAGIGAEVLGLRGAMLSFSDALLMQGKRAVSVGGGQVESSLVACTMEALVGAVYAEKGLEAASAFVTRLLPSLVDSRTAAPHSQKLEFGHEHEQESGHEHGHEYQQRLQQQDGGSDVRVGDAAAVGGMEFPEECDPVARLQEMSVQQLGLVPQYRHTGTDNPHTPHVTERVRVYAAGRRMGTGMGPTLEEAKRDGATKALLAWGKVFSGEGGSEEAGREASECAEERTGD